MLWNGQPQGGPSPIIVEREVWEQAQSAIDRKRTHANTIVAKYFRILAGMAYCECGQPLTTHHILAWNKQFYYHYYVCTGKTKGGCSAKRIQMDVVDELAWAKVLELTRNKEVLQRAIAKARGDQSDIRSEIAAHKKLIVQASERAGKLAGVLVGLSDPAITTPVQAQLRALDAEVKQRRQAVSDLTARLVDKETVKKSSALLRSLFPGRIGLIVGVRQELSPQQKRDVFQALGAKVIVDQGRVRVELNVPLVDSTSISSSIRPTMTQRRQSL